MGGRLDLLEGGQARHRRSRGRNRRSATRAGGTTRRPTRWSTGAIPLRILLTPGNSARHRRPPPELVEGCHGRWILADKAYDSDGFRDLLADLGLEACIPAKAGRKNPARHHAGFYKKRHKVENFF